MWKPHLDARFIILGFGSTLYRGPSRAAQWYLVEYQRSAFQASAAPALASASASNFLDAQKILGAREQVHRQPSLHEASKRPGLNRKQASSNIHRCHFFHWCAKAPDFMLKAPMHSGSQLRQVNPHLTLSGERWSTILAMASLWKPLGRQLPTTQSSFGYSCEAHPQATGRIPSSVGEAQLEQSCEGMLLEGSMVSLQKALQGVLCQRTQHLHVAAEGTGIAEGLLLVSEVERGAADVPQLQVSRGQAQFDAKKGKTR